MIDSFLVFWYKFFFQFLTGLGILGVGSAATRRMANVGKTYLRGISRIGSAATSRIGQASSVSRMGELAAEGASKVAVVATAVPQSISR